MADFIILMNNYINSYITLYTHNVQYTLVELYKIKFRPSNSFMELINHFQNKFTRLNSQNVHRIRVDQFIQRKTVILTSHLAVSSLLVRLGVTHRSKVLALFEHMLKNVSPSPQDNRTVVSVGRLGMKYNPENAPIVKIWNVMNMSLCFSNLRTKICNIIRIKVKIHMT